MPKYGIHHIVLNETIDRLAAYQPQNAGQMQTAREAAALLSNRDNKFYANLGAIGPDLFFFAEDYKIIETLLPVVEFVEEIIEPIIEPIEDIKEFIGTQIDQTLDLLGLRAVTEIKDRIKNIDEKIKELKKATIAAGLLQGISPLETETTEDGQATSPFARIARELFENILIPPLELNKEEVDWYWFDMLHYRNTGDFAKNLIDNADTDRKKAYALGYLTHIATDVVGHPYVNQIVGGPFRLGVQRHVTAENFMDAHQYDEDLAKSVGQSLAKDLLIDEDKHEELHDDIADLLHKAFEATYEGVIHPQRLGGDGFLTKDQIKTAYKLMRLLIKKIGEQENPKPEPDVDTAEEELADIMSAINFDDPPPPPPSLTPEAGVDWFDEWTAYLGEAAQYSLEIAAQLLKILRDLVEYAADTVGRPVLALLYGLELSLYELVRIAKWIIALNGFSYPEPDDIRGRGWEGNDSNVVVDLLEEYLPIWNTTVSNGLMFIFDPNRHFVYNPNVPMEKQQPPYPRLRIKGQPHLEAPAYNNECQNTLPAFHHPIRQADGSLEPAKPAAFIRDLPFSEDNLKAYAEASTPAETLEQQRLGEGGAIGNAIDFSAWLISLAYYQGPGKPPDSVIFANWNLDGDRGYGAKAWTALLPHNWDPTPMGQLSIVQAADTGSFPTAGLIEANGQISYDNAINGIRRDCVPDDDANDYIYAKIKAKNETYSDNRLNSDLRFSNLIESEDMVLSLDFEHFNHFQTRDADIWASILAPRLKVEGTTMRENIYYVNGVGTPAYDAFNERFNLEHFFRTGPTDRLDIKLLYNVTESHKPLLFFGDNRFLKDTSYEPDMIGLADGYQALQDKLWSHVTIYRQYFKQYGVTTWTDLRDHMENDPIDFSNSEMGQINNATTIAVIALLYEALKNDNPLGLIGYSHGTQILFNGIIAFGFQGDDERTFLKDKVKLFFIGRMVDPTSVKFVSRLVADFDELAHAADLVPDVLGDFPPALDGTNLTPDTYEAVRNDLISARDSEEHKMYRYAPEIKNDIPNHQNFF